MCHKNDGRVEEISSDIIYKLFSNPKFEQNERHVARGKNVVDKVFIAVNLKLLFFHVAGKTRKPNTLLRIRLRRKNFVWSN